MAIPNAISVPVPPRYVEYNNAVPAAFRLATKALGDPFSEVCHAPTDVGKSAEVVDPVTYTPALSTAIPYATSAPLPPRYVENTSAPADVYLATNTSDEPPGVVVL